MGDLISRQAAIDAFLTELTKRERKNLLHTWSTVEVKYFVADMLEKMPSEQPEIIRCKDCKHKPNVRGVNHDISFPDEVCPCQCEDYWYSWMPKDDWYCANAERRTDGSD